MPGKQRVPSAFIPSKWDFLYLGSVAIIYFVVARVSLAFILTPEGIAAIWPPTGIFLASILLCRRELRPWLAGVLFVTDFAAEMLSGTPTAVSAAYALALTGDAVLGSWLLLRFAGDPITFTRTKEVLAFIVLVVLCSNATMSLLAAAASAQFPQVSFWNSWRVWMISAGIGNLLVTPFIISWSSMVKNGLPAWNPTRAAEAVALVLGVTVTCYFAFPSFPYSGYFPLLNTYFALPFLIWAALRFGLSGVTLVLLIIGFLVMTFLVSNLDSGVLLHGSTLNALLDLQLYLAVTAIPLLVLSTVIKEQKQAQRALLRRTRQLQFVTDHVPVSIAHCNRDLRYEFVNKAYANMFGKEVADVTGRHVSEILGEAVFANAVTHMDEALSGQSTEYDLELALTGSGLKVVHVSYAPEYNTSGAVVGFLAGIVDVTEQRKAEEETRKSRSLLESLTSNTPTLVYALDSDGRFVFVNKTLTQMLGVSQSDMLGKNRQQLLPENVADNHVANDQEVLRTGKALEFEESASFDGATKTFLTVKFPLRTEQGAIWGVGGISTDISQRKKMDQELDRYRHNLEELVGQRTEMLAKAQAEAESASAAKSVFLANMSHEIRTPLNAIIGLTHLLKRAGTDATSQEVSLNRINDAGEHLLSIVNDILSLSKIEAGRLKLDITNFNLKDIFDHIYSMMSETALGKGLIMEVDKDGVPEWLRGDRTRLSQALLNYVSNAIKFSERGKIILRTRLLEDANDTLLLRFEVQDSGIGVAADKIPRLFQAFEQVGGANTSNNKGGTGLGLVITRRLVELMGGEVGVDSVPEQGSIFWFTVKLARGQVDMRHEEMRGFSSAEAELHLRHAGSRVLLAEDNAVNREVAVGLLQIVGLEVDVAVNGQEAVAKARDGDYDLILMDIRMPKLDGMEAAKAIRDLPGWESRPILAMTANAFDEDQRACEEAGMNDVIVKPVKPEQLFDKLLRWLEQSEIPAVPIGGMNDFDQGISTHSQELPTGPEMTEKELAIDAGLAAINGLDTIQGLQNLGGMRELYHQVLYKYAVLQGDDMARLRACLGQEDRDGMLLLAHSLKGASLSLGAVIVGDLAAELEQAIKSGSGETDIERLAAVVDRELKSLAATILSILPAAAQADLPN